MTTNRKEQPVITPTPEQMSVPLSHGAHDSREDGVCFQEWVRMVKGETHSGVRLPCQSQLLHSIGIRFNDAFVPKNAAEDSPVSRHLKLYGLKTLGTAVDGKDELRALIAADWSIRVALPAWLELAGVTETAERLRSMAPLTMESKPGALRDLRQIRDDMWELRQAKRAELRERVKAELKKRGVKVADADADAAAAAAAAAVADAAAVAVADADAAADAAAAAAAVADAAAAAAAVAAAVAAAAAAADADAAAAAAAAAAAVAAAPYGKAYNAAYEAAEEVLLPKVEEVVGPTRDSLQESAMDLLDRLIDPEPVAA